LRLLLLLLLLLMMMMMTVAVMQQHQVNGQLWDTMFCCRPRSKRAAHP